MTLRIFTSRWALFVLVEKCENTVCRVPVFNNNGFTFSISERTISNDLFNFFRPRRIKTGIERVDNEFSITSSHPEKIKLLFQDLHFTKGLLHRPYLLLELVYKPRTWVTSPKKEGKLICTRDGTSNDLDELRDIYHLMKYTSELLGRLCATP